MKRRSFLRQAVFGGAGFAAVRLGVPAVTVAVAARDAVASRSAGEEQSLAELQAGLASGRFTAASLARRFLERIETLDRRGPSLKSVLETNPDALAIAESLDRERRAKGPRGPLHGIPLLLKDNLDTRDRMSTTAGSLALLGSRPTRDASVVERLRQAGAVILGKTNLSEWANFRSSRSTSGWSARGGQTRNPYALDRNPSGSSSGSAVAVAANLCAAAVGTETDGSIVSPSSFNGIVGIKPTLGLVSRAGIIPIAHSQDTAGPMARGVADAALLLTFMAGPDPRDRATDEGVGRATADYTRALDPLSLQGARLGVARRFFGAHEQADRVIAAAIEAMKGCGAVIVDPADLPSHGKLNDPEFEVLLYEFKADLEAYLATRPGDASPHTLRQLIEFNEEHREREMPYFGQELFEKAEGKGPLTEPAYLDARAAARRLAREEGIDAVMDGHNLDALIAPTTGPAHVTDYVYGDRDTGGSSSPAAVAGYPAITVPAGFVSGLPVGVSFFGRAWSEARLIGLAFAFEQATKARRPPRFAARPG